MLNRLTTAALISGVLMTANVAANTVAGDVIYSYGGIFSEEIQANGDFLIDTPGIYRATLTDLENTAPFSSSSLDVLFGTNTLGSLEGPGSFDFDAMTGTHSVNLFASVAVSEEDKLAMIETLHMERFAAWKASLSAEELDAYRIIWKNRTEEERAAHNTEVFERNSRRVEQQIADMTGEFEVTISYIGEEVSPVPVPAAAWLFGSGLLGLAGVVRRKQRKEF